MNKAPADVLAVADEWYRRQLAKLEARHGVAWKDHQHWLDAYLREQLRQRLLERGWRRK